MEPHAYREMAETEDHHWWFVGRRGIISDILTELRLPESASILEVGAGTGGNLAMLQQYGSVSALELDDFAREYASRRSGLQVIYGALPDAIPFPKEQFDLICMFDVLEHVEQDRQSMKQLRGYLKTGGRILITVPAYPWLWSQHDEVLHHRRRYTRKMLRDVIEDAGLTVERLTSFNAVMLPLAIVARTMSQMIGRRGSPGASVPPALINSAVKKMLSFERLIIRNGSLPCGLSLLALAARQ